MADKPNPVIELPFVTRVCLDKRTVVTESAEQLICPECTSALELDDEEIDYSSEFEVDCPECECTLEIHPYRVESPNQINFTPAQDVSEFLAGYENKTAVLNAAVRLLKSTMEAED
jgi:hypothetical protein